MKKLTTLVAAMLFASAGLMAQDSPPQYPCSTFDGANPQGNWQAVVCYDSYSDINPLDNTGCVTLDDGPGGSYFTNQTDYNALGQKYLGKCLCFDYYLIDAGGSTAAVYPTIYLTDGSGKSIWFKSNTPVYELTSGWVHICAPIEHCTSSTLPSNADGQWFMDPGLTCADFNNILDNVNEVFFLVDITSCPCEKMSIDNVCVRDCRNCHSDFSLQAGINTASGQVDGTIFLNNANPGSVYKVNWGDGSPMSTPYVSHLYPSGAGSYNVCVFEYDEAGNFICSTCVRFCFGDPTHEYGDQGGDEGRGRAGKSTEEPVNAILSAIKNKTFSEESFSIFPNPAKDVAEIQLPKTKNAGAVSIRVIDMLGNVVSETNIKANGSRSIKINTDKFATGIYTVEVREGNTVSTQKISVAK